MSQKNIEQERDNILDELESNLTNGKAELTRLNKELSEFKEVILRLEQRHSDMEDAQKEVFVESLRQIEDDVRSSESPRQILEYKSDLRSAYQNPLIERIQRDIFTFYQSIGAEISEEEWDNLESKIRVTTETDPQESQQYSSKLSDHISTLSDSAVRAILREIEESGPISDPQKLDSLCSRYAAKDNQIENLENRLQTVGWAPEVLADSIDSVKMYRADGGLEQLEVLVKDIDSRVQTLSGLVAITDVLRSEIKSESTNLPERIIEVLTRYDKELTSIVEYEETLQFVDEISDIVNSSGESHKFLDEYERLTTDPPKKLSDLSDIVVRISERYSVWKEDIRTKWAHIHPILETYEERIDESPPTKIQKYVDEGVPIDNRPSQAYSAVSLAEVWIDEKEDEFLEGYSEEARDAFYQLSTKGEYKINEENIDSIAELMDILDLKVVIEG